MKMGNCTIYILSAAAAFVSPSAVAGWAGSAGQANVWQAHEGEYSGDYTDAFHWQKGNPPRIVSADGVTSNVQYGCFNAHPGTPYTVTYPQGAFASPAGLQVQLADGDDVTFDGEKTLLTQESAGWGIYPFRVAVGTDKFAFMYNTGERAGGYGGLSNFIYKASMSGGAARLELVKGVYDYVAPEGDADFRWDLFPDVASGCASAAVVLGSDVDFKTDTLYVFAKTAPENIVAVTGATVNAAEKMSVSGYAGNKLGIDLKDSSLSTGAFSASGGEITMRLDGSLFASDSFSFGNQGAAAGSMKMEAEDSIVSVVGSIKFNGGSDVQFIDSTCDVRAVQLINGAKLRAVGGMLSALNDNSYIGLSSSGYLRLENGCECTVAGGSMFLGLSVSGANKPEGTLADVSPSVTGRVDLVGSSTLDLRGARISIGETYGATGIFEVKDDSAVKSANGEMHVGRWGTGFADVSGGNLEGFKGITVAGYGTTAPAGTETAESVLVQTGGRIATREGNLEGITVAVQAGRKGRVRLEGGVTEVGFIAGGAGATVAGGGGWAAFEADGGRIVAQATTDSLIAGFDEAVIGEKGLVVESDSDVGIPQAFSGESAASAAGPLVLAGEGTKTLSMTSGAPSVVVAAEGSVAFAAGADIPETIVVTNRATVVLSGEVTLENLVVGTADTLGILCVDPTTRITVTGSLDIRNMELKLDGDFPVDTSYDLFKCAEGFDEDVVSALQAAFVDYGFPSGISCDFSAVTGEDGATTLRFDVETGDRILIELDEGEETHSTNILWHCSKTLETDVAEGAALTLSGDLGYGKLEKTGAGALYLTGTGNMFCPGLLLEEGLLSVDCQGALGSDGVQVLTGPRLAGGMLEVTGSEPVRIDKQPTVKSSEADGLVEVRTVTDVTMPMPSVTRGALRKRGPGTLTFEAFQDGAECAFSSKGAPELLEDMSQYSGLTVQEGEMVFRGTKPGIANTLPSNIDVGVPGEAHATGKVQPGIVFDNIDFTYGYNRRLNLGAYVKNDATNAYNGSILAEANSFVTDPYLIVTNGAALRGFRLHVFEGTGSSRHLLGGARVYVDGSTVEMTREYFTVSASGGTPCVGSRGCYASHEFVNGSELRAPTVIQRGSCTVKFVDSFLGGFSDDSTTPTVIAHNVNEMTSRWEFVRSEFCVSLIHRATPGAKCAYGQNYFFEDTLWSCGDNDLMVGSTNVNMNIYVRGRGLRFAPYEGRTYEVIRKIRGDGAVVMDGPGTLRFGRSRYLDIEQADPVDIDPDPWTGKTDTGTELYDPCTVCYTGGTEVNAGTVDFGGFALSGMRLSGKGGTVRNAAFSGVTLASTNLTFGADVSFGATTKFDFSSFGADKGDSFVVGRYEGETPDVSRWRGRNFAAGRLKAVFTAKDGVITADIDSAGSVIVLR